MRTVLKHTTGLQNAKLQQELHIHFKDLLSLPGAPPVYKSWMRMLNKLMAKLNFPFELCPIPNGKLHMNTIEQRMNIIHLVRQVLDAEIYGEFVEFGCHNGQSAVLIQKILDTNANDQKIWAYDHFGISYSGIEDVFENFHENIFKARVSMPLIIQGDFNDTIPEKLPQAIAFAHIDVGNGGIYAGKGDTVLYLLKNIYPRLTTGAIVLLMDYHDTDNTVRGMNINPGVKIACDEFFKNIPERINTLYGNQYSHAYFRKS